MQPDQKNDDLKCCVATQSDKNQAVLHYIEDNTPLSNEHIIMYNQLRIFVDNILLKKIEWRLTKIPIKLLQIVDHNDLYGDKIFATDDMYKYLQTYANTKQLIATCTGSNYNLKIAQQSILDAVQWRISSKIDNINPSQFQNSLQTKTCYNINTFDKNGHPIIYFNVLKIPPKEPWMIVRCAVYTIEKCIKLTENNGKYQILWLVDIKHLSYSTMPPIEILQEILSLMTYYYPERLHAAYMLYSPFIFSVFFGMIKPFLPIKTQNKVYNPGWYQSNDYNTFKDYINKSQLLKKYGGDLNDAQYDYKWEQADYNKRKQIKLVNNGGNDAKNNDNDGNDTKNDNNNDDNDDDDDDTLCIVCLDGDRDHVLIPCGHVCVCKDCKVSYDDGKAPCPLCRAKVQMVVKTFH